MSDEPYFRSWPCICRLGKHVWCPAHSKWEPYVKPQTEQEAVEVTSELDF